MADLCRKCGAYWECEHQQRGIRIRERARKVQEAIEAGRLQPMGGLREWITSGNAGAGPVLTHEILDDLLDSIWNDRRP